jgi:hypothetical protein
LDSDETLPELHEKKNDSIEIDLDESLRRYLGYLKKIKHIKNEEEAIESALEIYKKLNMHEWMPYIYRSGNERLLIISHGMFNDILSTIPESRLHDLAKSIALKRKVLRTFDPNLDLTQLDNWNIILNEMENLGWGKFSRDFNEIKIEYPGVPLSFLRGYLEALFNIEFSAHVTTDGKIMVLRPKDS